MIRLSHSAVQKYNQCSLCYDLHYNKGVRLKKTKSSLLFGSILDSALNELLLTKDLEKSLEIFQKSWQKIDSKTTEYLKSDLDEELLNHFKINHPEIVKEWRSLQIKGRLFIQQYYHEILPKIKKVIAVQEPISIKNEEGDEITGFLDLVVEWEDGKIYLLDNKSSSYKYEPDSARLNNQLPLYYYATKKKYKLDGIGYIVLMKKINKNRMKICEICQTINVNSHKTCNQMHETEIDNIGYRCNGKFEITINPTVNIQYVFNEVQESDISRVIDLFDVANYNISNNIFATEHNPERGKFGFCDYKDYYEGSPDFFIKDKNEKK